MSVPRERVPPAIVEAAMKNPLEVEQKIARGESSDSTQPQDAEAKRLPTGKGTEEAKPLWDRAARDDDVGWDEA